MVVLPTYNEKENIEKIVPLILKQDERLQVLVVDDQSPDHTADAVRELQKVYSKRLHLISRHERGRGSAVICGFKEALKLGAAFVFEMDADFSHNPNDIPRFLNEIEKADVVVGSRFIAGGGIEQRGWFRNMLSRILNALIRFVLGLKLQDASGGFRLFRQEVLKAINFDQILSKNYSFCPEILYRVKKLSFTIKEIPILFINRKVGKSKASFKIALDYLISILKIRFTA